MTAVRGAQKSLPPVHPNAHGDIRVPRQCGKPPLKRMCGWRLERVFEEMATGEQVIHSAMAQLWHHEVDLTTY